MRRVFAILPILYACGDAPDDTGDAPESCEATSNPLLEIAQYGPYGELVDGSALLFGNPPQGGAPYAPFSLRISGMDQGDLGMGIEMEAIDSDTQELLGTGSYTQRFLCSNTGDNDGTFVGADLHMRFFGWALEDLDGRAAQVVITAANDDGIQVEASYLGVLERE
jgi:hypothetical protein